MTVKCKGYRERNGLTGEGLLSKDRILGMQVGIWPDPVQEVFYIFCLFFFFFFPYWKPFCLSLII